MQHTSWAIALSDCSLSIFASLISIMLIRWLTEPVYGFSGHVLWWVAYSFVISIIMVLLTRTHMVVIHHASFKSTGRLALAAIFKVAVLLVLLLTRVFTLNAASAETTLLIVDGLLTFVFMLVFRVIILVVQDSVRESMELNIQRLPVMVYGTSNKSVSLVMRLSESIHYSVIGYLSPSKEQGGQILQETKVYHYESADDFAKLRTRIGIGGVLFPSDADGDPRAAELVSICMHCGVHVLSSPSIGDMTFGGMSQHSIQQVNRSDDYIPDSMSSFERNVKRLIDMVLAAILLVIFSPLFLICFIAIKMDDGGPAIFRQERIGRFGRPFNIYKFRSMRVDAESAGPALYSGDDDPRMTKVGKFMRQHHLDELPQLWNVFKGDMAFIGYRPERKFYIDQIMEADPRYYYLYQIRPGVTSYATLYNGYTDSMEKMLRRLEYDLYYLRHRSWWFDMKVLFFTFMNIVFGKKF